MDNSQIYRATKGGLVKVGSMVDNSPTTKRGTPVTIQGRPRHELPQGGVHLILYPTFKKWLRKSAAYKAAWDALPDRRRYFTMLAVAAMLPPDSKSVAGPLTYCFAAAPGLTCAALVVLLKRAAKVQPLDYAAATSTPHYGDSVQVRSITPREADRRRDARKAHADFMADTA